MKKQSTPTTGHIFNVQHFCVDDGPGIRTTVFFKGCPLRCAWCHNPESHSFDTEIMLHEELCLSCGACVAQCQNHAHRITKQGEHSFDRSLCRVCGACTSLCPVQALEKIGRAVTVEEVLDEILTDRVFLQTSKGGVTLSGGEPTAQSDFSEELLSACKAAGLHTCVETCAWCDEDALLRLIPHTDLFLVDWKITDNDLHRKYTGASNAPILQNLALLHRNNSPVVLRCPLIPGVNTTPEHYDGIARLALRYSNVRQIDLEPYHPMGLAKAAALGKRLPYASPDFLSAKIAEEAKRHLQSVLSLPVRISAEG